MVHNFIILSLKLDALRIETGFNGINDQIYVLDYKKESKQRQTLKIMLICPFKCPRRPGVYFTKILQAAFSYESVSSSSFVLFWQKEIGAKAACKMLKLTAEIRDPVKRPRRRIAKWV